MLNGKSYNIAVVFPNWYSFLHGVIEGILEIRGIRHHCNFRNFITSDIDEPVQFPQGYQPDGILTSFDNDRFEAAWLKNLDLPTVNIFGSARRDYPTISGSAESMACTITDHFIALGFQEIGVLETADHPSGQLVSREIQTLCEQRGVPFWKQQVPDGIRAGSWLQLDALVPELKTKLLNRKVRVGVYATHDMRGRLLADYCTEHSIRVPEDVGILGRFDSVNSRLCTPELSSVVMPEREMGALAIQLLVSQIEGKTVEKKEYPIQVTDVRVRESTVGQSNPDMIVLQARAIIRENACKGLTVDELAQTLPIARSTFEKRYRALTGSTPAQDIRQFRTETARKLLLTSCKTIDEVAAAVGFNDPRPFVVFFKREVGIPPGEFRKEYAG